jgi:hypothetical protein
MKASTQEQRTADEPAAKPLAPAAARALAEAEERRKSLAATDAQKEIGGRGGPDPARYGDWEAKGIAHDF